MYGGGDHGSTGNKRTAAKQTIAHTKRWAKDWREGIKGN